MKRLSLIFLGLFSALFIQSVSAQTSGLKIGSANVEFILSNLPETKQIENDLKTYEKQLNTQLESKYAEYQRKLEEYQKGVSSGLMPDAVKADKEKELLAMQQSIQDFEKSAQDDMQRKQMTMLEPVLEKVQASIDKVAAANGYTYIFSTHADFGGSAIILYSRNKDQDDISTLVLKDMGVTLPAPGTTTTGATTGTPHSTTATPVTTTPAPKATTPTKK
ncbi:MAG: OmpH family outer membrane protein [Cytophagales bacterium]|nr:OmpH family outer membrane protein [Cytophaga sp.]